LGLDQAVHGVSSSNRWGVAELVLAGMAASREMGKTEVEVFLSHLAQARKVAVSTQNQALNALVFLYREVLHQPFDQLERVERAHRLPRIPVVLSRAELTQLLAANGWNVRAAGPVVVWRRPAVDGGSAVAGSPREIIQHANLLLRLCAALRQGRPILCRLDQKFAGAVAGA